MSEKSLKLWVIKFCLKVIYPKYNIYTFLAYLAIKYRIYLKRNQNMDVFTLQTVPQSLMKGILEDYLEENRFVLCDKCILISREQYIQLCAENLFYIDNGVLWLALKLTQDTKSKCKEKTNRNTFQLKFQLNFMGSEIHKKLFNDEQPSKIDSVRVVPVVGSKLVSEGVGLVTENEFQNIINSCGLKTNLDIMISFHPVPSLECSPKIAAAAEVCVIVNDFDLSNDFVKEVLGNYFEQPKLISLNDIITVDLTPTVTGTYHYKYLDLIESVGRLYFKFKRITSDVKEINKELDKVVQPFFVVKGVTQLTLGESIHHLKPKDEYFKTHKCKKAMNFLKLCPTGLKEKFDQIQDAISPFLTGEMNDLSSSMSSPITPMLLLTGSMGSGRHILVKTIAKYSGLNWLQIDCSAVMSSTAKQTESKINSMVQKAKAAAPTIVILDNFEVFAVDPENNEDCRVLEYFVNNITELYQNYTKHHIIFVAITERVDLKPNVLRIFLERIHIPKLKVQQRYEMLEWFVAVMQLNIEQDEKSDSFTESSSNLSSRTKEVLHRIAAKTDTFLYGDLDTLLHFAMRESYLTQQSSSDADLRLVKEDDFSKALESLRTLHSQHLDAPKIPKVYWEDIGGLDKLKKEILKTIEFPIKYPHLFKNSSLKRSGILMYGPPGCGKTLVAKAVSTELNVSFLSVKGPELLNMYIGQSEENVRKVFESARASSPCIIFLDELDALAPARGSAGDSGGASDRVVSQLLAELDGVASGEDVDSSSFVFIMGATNRPDLLEQSLLRPGRLDKLIYVGPYTGTREKISVLTALSRSYNLSPEVNLETISEALPDRCTGADLLHVVSTARAAAVRRIVDRLKQGIIKESELSPDSVILGANDLWKGVETFRPSVSVEDLAYYESIRSQM